MDEADRGLLGRLWIYQRERFPLVQHGPVISAFAFCAAAYSARLRDDTWPEWTAVIVAIVSCLAFFLQLRIADEFKDAEEDARYRPYRAVPRGLVSLRTLGIIFALSAIMQAVLAVLYFPALLWLLLVAWVYLTAMCVEFGVGEFLKQRPVAYLLSHMLIMPIVDAYATSADWMPAGTGMPPELPWFLALSFSNGLVIELGRKIRHPRDEEEGVSTYSALWGPRRASIIWLLLVVCTLTLGGICAWYVQALWLISPVLLVVFAWVAWTTVDFLRHPQPGRGKRVETAAGLWTLILYLALGLLPGLKGLL